METNGILGGILNISPFFVLKFFVVVGLLLYVIFSLVVLRQVQLMLEVLNGSGQKGLKFIALIHFLAVVFLFIIALIIL